MPRFAVFALITLAACGAEAPPQAPAAKTASGVTISATASTGVTTKN